MASLKKCTLRIFAHFSFPFTRKVVFWITSFFSESILLFIKKITFYNIIFNSLCEIEGTFDSLKVIDQVNMKF